MQILLYHTKAKTTIGQREMFEDLQITRLANN